MAKHYHEGQVDKAGQPYIQHPLRVMQRVNSAEAKMAAVMHDLLEDTAVTAQQLHCIGFAPDIIDAVQALTKQPHDSRFSAAQRTVKNPLACQVKLADLADNMDLSRLNNQISAKDTARMAQYRVVHAVLHEADRIYSLVRSLHPGEDYPAFDYAERAANYQYLLHLMFDLSHPLGSAHTGYAQEWWSLFEECAAYFSWCTRHQQPVQISYAMSLIQAADTLLYGGAFSDDRSRAMMEQLLMRFAASLQPE